MSARAAPPVTAVIAAAGSGERLGAGGPKAFVPLCGRPLVQWSVEAFRQAAGVRAIVVACPPGHDLDGHDLGGDDRDAPELSAVDGGATRAESVANALAAVGTDLVAIHDAARPLVTPQLIEGVVAALDADGEADGAIAAAPVTDTIKRASSPAGERVMSYPHQGVVNPSVAVEATVERDRLWAAQTPQAFRTAALRRALEAHPADAQPPTDEAMLIEAVGGRVLIHAASPQNLKVTTPLDLKLAELLLSERSTQ